MDNQGTTMELRSPMEVPWESLGNPMGTTVGSLSEVPREPHGSPTEAPWKSHGNYYHQVCPTSHGSLMELQWDYPGITIRGTRTKPTVVPWISPGKPHGIPVGTTVGRLTEVIRKSHETPTRKHHARPREVPCELLVSYDEY